MWLYWLAFINAVHPLLFCKLTFAPADSKLWTMSSFPTSHAIMSAVLPSLSKWLMSIISRSRRNLTASIWPALTALWRAYSNVKLLFSPSLKTGLSLIKKPKTPIRRMNCNFPSAYSIRLSAVESRTVYFIMTDPVKIVMYFISDCWYSLGSKCRISRERPSMLLVYHASCSWSTIWGMLVRSGMWSWNIFLNDFVRSLTSVDERRLSAPFLCFLNSITISLSGPRNSSLRSTISLQSMKS